MLENKMYPLSFNFDYDAFSNAKCLFIFMYYLLHDICIFNGSLSHLGLCLCVCVCMCVMRCFNKSLFYFKLPLSFSGAVC